MSLRMFSPMRSAPLYWISNGVLALVAFWVVLDILSSPVPKGEMWFEGLFYFIFLLFAPGTLSLLAMVFVIASGSEPPILLRLWAYIAAAFYLFAFYAIYTVSSL